MKTYAWIVGGRGLLGSAIGRAIEQRTDWALVASEPLPWGDDDALFEAAGRAAARLMSSAAESGARWSVIWAAGAAVTSSSAEALERELQQFTLVLDAIAAEAQRRQSARQGSVFYASSAGGVYGGSAHPPFDETSVPVPISGYGRFKLAAEQKLFDFSEAADVSVLAGRIANLYGPGQKLGKMQGLISHLAKAQLSPAPASIFVPLDTIRDYIYVGDCATLVLDSIERLLDVSAASGTTRAVKILASGQGVTISNLLGHFRILAKGHPHVMLGSSGDASLQGLDLRLRSSVWPDLDRRDLTPLPVGIRATIEDVLGHIQAGA